MTTYTPPEYRSDKNKILQEINFISRNPVIDALLDSVSGLFAVLDENRQILAVNDEFLQSLGVTDSESVLGLRPGETIECVYADAGSDGCGTSDHCSSCGMAIAIVSSLALKKPVEKQCAILAEQGGNYVNIAFKVRSQPIQIEGTTFILIYLQDITKQQQRAALERVFFHDVNNAISALIGASELLNNEPGDPQLVNTIYRVAVRLADEMKIQHILINGVNGDNVLARNELMTEKIIFELKTTFETHPSAQNKHLSIPDTLPNFKIRTNGSLVFRVLMNMLINAFEATEETGTIKLWVERNDASLTFKVWNNQVISTDIAKRLFQRNYSTKAGSGRGVGTYSMKFFGEEFLGGKIDYSTSQTEGTVFSFELPYHTGTDSHGDS